MPSTSLKPVAAACTLAAILGLHSAEAQDVAPLPPGVQAVWDLQGASTVGTPTHQRICINGLWQWQPAADEAGTVPQTNWGHFKVPGPWPGITNYMQKDCQTVFAHPSWKDSSLRNITSAWYQREITIPKNWSNRRLILEAAHVNSFAEVYIDGIKAGEIRFPAGEVDLTDTCQAGKTYLLSIRVDAMPLKAVMLSYSDTASAKQVKGSVARRGLCGDVFLACTPPGARIDDVKVETSVRDGKITFDTSLANLGDDSKYVLQARVVDGDDTLREFTSKPFDRGQLDQGRFRFTKSWIPYKLWDVHTPDNIFNLHVSLLGMNARVRDAALPVRFGFREFWIDGRDFYLNGKRIFLSSVPFDNAQVGAAWATYDAARESMKRLASFGINFVYTHNYGCEPGTHLSFEEILRAADDTGMLVAFSQPHFGQYDWKEPDAEQTNGYAQHAEFYVRVAQNHPAVVAYSTSHNAAGYSDDMNPLMIDGIQNRRNEWSQRNADRALRAEAIIRKLDPSRIVYHHAGGNIGAMHTINFYANFVPRQEMSDWFEHWATHGVKPLFTCEYAVPFPWDWTMYRGWYNGKREFGSAVAPWEFCMAEWNAQFVGDKAYRISQQEKRNLRWEAKQFEAERAWHRWDYPHQVGSEDFAERYPVYAEYFADNWPAFRTWGVSATSPWSHGHYWKLRDGVDRARKDLDVDWQNLQRPGFSPDYLEDRYERIDLAYEFDDWIPTVAAKALIRNNGPLLAYIAGNPGAFTSKDHNYFPGETVEKQLVVVNNSRETVEAEYSWVPSLWRGLVRQGRHEGMSSVSGSGMIQVEPGGRERFPLVFELPVGLASGTYEINAKFRFCSGEDRQDSISVNILPRPRRLPPPLRIALFDPRGETTALLNDHMLRHTAVDADVDLNQYDILVIGKHALTLADPAPEISSVRNGLKVLIFEQSADVLEKRFGFRVATYGLRQVFTRVPDHPTLAGLSDEHLRDWRGEATLVASHSAYPPDPKFNYAPTDRWCGIPVTRIWRCGNRGNVASVLIEKPARGDFLPILDGGYSLQYSPLMQYREGQGMILFCQMDVTGRTEQDPAAEILVHNLFDHIAAWQPAPQRWPVYAGNAQGKQYLQSIGIHARSIDDEDMKKDDVLIVGSGGDRELADHATAIGKWLDDGGHVLAFGLNDRAANSFLPTKVEIEDQEHIATWFEPFGRDSLLAGVSPADVHNATPRTIPLLVGDAAIGNGVLGQVKDTHIVFAQMPPYNILTADAAQKEPESTEPGSVTKQHNLKRTYRRASFLTNRLLANMGVAAPTLILKRFSTPVADSEGPSIVRNGNFALDANADNIPDEWDISPSATQARERTKGPDSNWALRISSPPADDDKKPSVMLAQYGIPMKEGQWYRVSFFAKAEDMDATDIPVTITNTAKWRSLFDYQRFTPGPEWKQFRFEVQSKETVEEKTRMQIWYEGAGTLWLSGIRTEPIPNPTQGRWLEGLYADTPEEWDNPYRFFRW
jgi:beta-galactosidase